MQESRREREGRALASIASFFNTSSSFSLVVRSGPSARLTVLELAAVDELDEDRWAGGGGGWGVERAEEDDVRLKGGRDEADVWNESSDCEWTNAGAGETMIPFPMLRARRCTLRGRGGGVAGSRVEVAVSRASSDYSDRVLPLSPISSLFSLSSRLLYSTDRNVRHARPQKITHPAGPIDPRFFCARSSFVAPSARPGLPLPLRGRQRSAPVAG